MKRYYITIKTYCGEKIVEAENMVRDKYGFFVFFVESIEEYRVNSTEVVSIRTVK